jgi:hypothetical protein
MLVAVFIDLFNHVMKAATIMINNSDENSNQHD